MQGAELHLACLGAVPLSKVTIVCCALLDPVVRICLLWEVAY